MNMIEVKNVSMRFLMANDRITSIKEYIMQVLKRKLQYREFEALRNVSFEVRKGEIFDYPRTTRVIAGKTIWESTFPIEVDDVFIAMSDGAEWAGVGMMMNFGWTRDSIAQYAMANYLPENSAKFTAGLIIDECNRLYGGKPGDDTTIAVAHVRGRHTVNLVVGPPEKKEDDIRMMNLFFGKDGTRIVCGGTTSNVVSRYLGQPIIASLDYHDPEVPPISTIKGVDLTTEGVITLSKVLAYAEDFLDQAKLAPLWSTRKDGASLIARELFENATDINFFVGRAINPAHQNPNLPINFAIKQQLITNLANCLQKMGKHIRLSYF